MTEITPEILANAAKALGVEWMTDVHEETLRDAVAVDGVQGTLPFGPGFAEWAVPVLEENHGLELCIWLAKIGQWDIAEAMDDRLQANGPDIDTAVLLLAANIGEGIE